MKRFEPNYWFYISDLQCKISPPPPPIPLPPLPKYKTFTRLQKNVSHVDAVITAASGFGNDTTEAVN